MRKVILPTVIAVLPALLAVSCCRTAKDAPMKPYALKIDRVDDIGLRAQDIRRIKLECGVPADSWLRLKADIYEDHRLKEEKGISFGIGYTEGQRVNALLDLTSADYLSRLGVKDARDVHLLTFATDSSTTGPILIRIPPSAFAIRDGAFTAEDGAPFVFGLHQAPDKDGLTSGTDFSDSSLKKIIEQSPYVVLWKIEVSKKEAE